jgi:hypothetical protein
MAAAESAHHAVRGVMPTDEEAVAMLAAAVEQEATDRGLRLDWSASRMHAADGIAHGTFRVSPIR